jgi:hypothetical protein
MVVWVFAGGGEAEVRGLIPFFEKHFSPQTFDRKTPIKRKPRGKANKTVSDGTEDDSKPIRGYGKTGKSLIEQIQKELPIALQSKDDKCDVILVFDDLDCRDHKQQKQKFLEAIKKIDNTDDIPIIVAFAAPELESWIIADWDNSIAKHSDFRTRHEKMRYWLSKECKIPFGNPESFSEYDHIRDCCQEKLSELLIESTTREDDSNVEQIPFSKKEHTPLLIMSINPDIVNKKCPLFRSFYNELRNFGKTQNPDDYSLRNRRKQFISETYTLKQQKKKKKSRSKFKKYK